MLAGTPEYLPPEVFNPENKIGYEVDWWCFGCLIF
jgi:serine/threonine protein kinase